MDVAIDKPRRYQHPAGRDRVRGRPTRANLVGFADCGDAAALHVDRPAANDSPFPIDGQKPVRLFDAQIDHDRSWSASLMERNSHSGVIGMSFGSIPSGASASAIAFAIAAGAPIVPDSPTPR